MLKRITGGQVTAKIMTTIISKARLVKPTIKWWLRRNEKRIFCTKIINELNRKIVCTQTLQQNEDEQEIFCSIGYLQDCNLTEPTK